MVVDAHVSPMQEINYLRTYTEGDPQRLVDNFRQRIQNDPVALLNELWRELESRFGSTAVITESLLKRLKLSADFKEKEYAKLHRFADLCAHVQSQVEQLPGLACLNYPIAIQPIVEQLPRFLQTKWEKEIVDFAERNADAFPKFRNFATLIIRQAKLKNNPNVLARAKPESTAHDTPRRPTRRALKTGVDEPAAHTAPRSPEYAKALVSKKSEKHCAFHDRDGHELIECKAFSAITLEERTKWIRDADLCFRCLSPGHQAKGCQKKIACSICGDERHLALLNREKGDGDKVTSKCTSVCNANGGLSCGKIVPVDVFEREYPGRSYRVYAILDEQSNSSLISSELADDLGISTPSEPYLLTTCSGTKEMKFGRRAANISIESMAGNVLNLPTLIECDNIPSNKNEIPTPELAQRFPHLRGIAEHIPPLDESLEIHLLIGRDAPEILKVREFINGPPGTPWAQRLLVGWTITGQMCLDLVDGPTHVLTRRTILSSPQTLVPREVAESEYELAPCPNQRRVTNGLSADVFMATPEDNEPSLSVEDRQFLDIMDSGIHKNERGNWEMPLPFRSKDPRMPNNKAHAMQRINSLMRTLRRKPQTMQDYVQFIGKMLERGHAEEVPSDEVSARKHTGRVRFLPHFAVYHPKKPTQIRVVFDSSAEFEGQSLNKELLAGPDMMNTLLGVLLRFRRERVGVMCDVEQMFHSFYVDPKDRDFLSFLWFKNNDPSLEIVEYRMLVHLFGNGPSPAIATYGLRRAADDGEENHGEEVKEFIHRNFYVDDGLASGRTVDEVIRLVRGAQAALADANLRLHKIVSNSVEVMEAIPADDRGKDVRDLDLRHDTLPAQRSLGVYWDLESDSFTFRISMKDKPFTRRGVLSNVNSIYDPLGLAAPVTLEGRKILQQLVAMGKKTLSAGTTLSQP